MSPIFAIFLKEMTETLRDRRTVFNAFVMGPLLSPLLFIGMLSMTASKLSDQAEKRLALPVVGAENAPQLIEWLKGQSVDIKEPPADPERALRDKDVDVVLRIGKDFPEQWRKSLPAPIEVMRDSSNRDAAVATERVENLLESYGRTVGALRLVARGLLPAVATPLQITHRDAATLQSRSGEFLSFLPYLLLLTGFLGGGFLAMDATAGERERQSLEPLLVNPMARGAIMSGKLAAVAAFAMISLALTMISFKVCLGMSSPEKLGVALKLSWPTVAQMFVVLLPIVIFGGSLLTLLSAFAKSYKEAQSYMSLLMLLPMIPTLLLMIYPVKTKLWMLAVPFLAQNQLIMMLLRGETVLPVQWLTGIGAGLAAASLVWLIAARLYHREQLAVST